MKSFFELELWNGTSMLTVPEQIAQVDSKAVTHINHTSYTIESVANILEHTFPSLNLILNFLSPYLLSFDLN